MSTEPSPAYAYHCEDRSILLSGYKRFVVPWWRWAVPQWLPANMITLVSSASMWAAAAVALHTDAFSVTTLVILTLGLTQTFFALDHIDGMRAKATRTSSPLGEYLDHSLDTYHGGILTLTAVAMIGSVPVTLTLLLFSGGFLAFAATMVEQKERGKLFFGWFGTLEAMVLFVIFHVTWLSPAVRAWWVAPLYGDWPAYWLLAVAGGLGCIGTIADCLRRIGRMPVALAVFIVANVTLAVALGRIAAPFGYLMAAMFLHGGDYVGRVIGSHLLRRPNVWPDVVAPLLAIAGGFGPAWIMPALLAWLTVRTAWGVWSVVSPMRVYWRWKNPPDVAS